MGTINWGKDNLINGKKYWIGAGSVYGYENCGRLRLLFSGRNREEVAYYVNNCI